MNRQERYKIELSIRKISNQIRKDILKQQREGQTPTRLDIALFKSMLKHWGELRQYYRTVYEEKDETKWDMDISLYLVDIYLYWHGVLISQIHWATEKGESKRVEQLEDCQEVLEFELEHILEVVRNTDQFFE